jgi:ABC-type transport system involved in multi-copper enzyme maturation permease subunit
MKILALITDTFREIYAKKVVFGIIAIEVIVLTITALILFSDGNQAGYREAAAGGLHAPADSALVGSSPAGPQGTASEQTKPRFTVPDDTSLLGADEPAIDSAAHPGTSSRTLQVSPTDSAALVATDGSRQLREVVSSQMAAYAAVIAAAVVFLGIFATAGIVPSMMEKGTIDLLLSKPLPRWMILLGRALGGITALGMNLILFLLALLALYGIASGVWVWSFVTATFGIAMFTFIVIYSAVILLNVTTEGWILPMSLVYLHFVILANFLRGREATLFTFISSEPLRRIIDGLYYILPQTSDLIANTDTIYTGSIDHTGPFVQGAIFMVAMLGLALWRFERRDF